VRTPDQESWLLEKLWLWKETLILLPAVCGLVLLLGHLLLRLLRWFWNDGPAEGEPEQLGLERDRKTPSPLLASLVERENRRATERARFRENGGRRPPERRGMYHVRGS